MKMKIIGLPEIHDRYVIAWIEENTKNIYYWYWSSYKSQTLAKSKVTDLNRTDLFITFVMVDTKED